MLQILPLVLFIVMTEVSIGSVSVLVFLDWRNEVKRGFLISYALIYLALTGLTYLFQQGFANPELLNTYPQLDKAWTDYLTLPLLLFFLLLIPYNLFLWIDRNAGVDSKIEQAKAEAQGQSRSFSGIRLLRLLSGIATVVAGLTMLFVMAMIFRPLAAVNLGGAITVAGFFASAFALGGVLTAMWLGHWYLVTPALSEKPLQFATTLVLIAILAQVLFTFTAGPTTAPANLPTGHTSVSAPAPGTSVKPANAPVITPLSTGAIGWLHILVGFVLPLILGALAWKLIRDRSFQSATGMLYLVVVCTLAGEAMARGLFLMGL
ncbi:MAG: hypothetical protein JO031_10265 [Ktedonobacteraceae bacterium]|nr:hypothetical protein [Ktedonobacteraceae bacterium]